MRVLTMAILKILGFGAIVGGGLVISIPLLCIFGVIGIYVWPYAINSWLLYCGKAAQVLWWHGFLLGVIPKLGVLGIILAMTTWIAMMFLR